MTKNSRMHVRLEGHRAGVTLNSRYFAYGLAGLAFVAIGLVLVVLRPGVRVARAPTAASRPAQQMLSGIGILGDSNSDEYRGDDNRGGAYAATTLNWMEQLAQNRDLDFGAWGTWGGVRRSGYEYNWARSGATANSLISEGQHTGLAKQIAQGKISYVVLYIGTNDFSLTNGTYMAIYDGTLSDRQVRDKTDEIVADITTAVDTIMRAGPVKMVIATFGDPGYTPGIEQWLPDTAGRERVSNAIAQVNLGIESLATKYGDRITVVDYVASLLPRIDADGRLNVGGEQIDVAAKGDDPHFGRLDDASGHPGTVLSGILANLLFVEPVDRAFGLDVQPLSDAEILEAAGIAAPDASP